MSGPDEVAVSEYFASAAFRRGEAMGQWRLVRLDGRIALVGVTAAARTGSPDEYVLRFDLTGYPRDPPTATVWDVQTNQKLDHSRWPSGSGRVGQTFRPDHYENGKCLYLACDRLAIQQHNDPAWAAKYPQQHWREDSNLGHYLEIVHGILNNAEYTGCRSPRPSA